MDRTTIDIWRDTGAALDVSGTITADTAWSPAASPYRVMGEVTVADGVTLTIEPGTSVYFDAGAQLTVRGRLVAVGTEQQSIRFTRVPGSGATWNGVQFVGTSQENRIAYAVLEYAVTDRGMIGLVNSRADLDHLLLDNTNRRRIELSNASMTLRNSTFTDMFGAEEPPNNVAEQIHGVGIAAGGQMIIENNWFGTTKGHNDVIDFSGPAGPGPILQVLGNTFTGSGDELIDLGGDAYIEGNLFQNVHKDEFNTGAGDANAISTGDDNFDANITVVRNVFRDVDHAVYLKGGTFMVFENNTVIDIPDDTADAEFSAINFVIPGRDAPGKGALLDGNIFVNVPRRIFGHVDEGTTTDLVMRNSLVPAARETDQVGTRPGTIFDLGEGNLAADANLVDPASDFRLRPGSPAIGAGAGGLDMGARVPAGASISSEPATVTPATTATLSVGGPGITHYRYRLNDGPFGLETAVSTPIELTDLADGTYRVAVVGRNAAGVWQAEGDATFSRSWTVDTSFSQVRISEILARNIAAVDHEGTRPDLVELHNGGAVDVDLAGMSLSDRLDNPAKFVFPAGTVIRPGEYLVLYADSNTGTSGLHLGFALEADSGEGVYLFNSQAAGGGLVDSVQVEVGGWGTVDPARTTPAAAVRLDEILPPSADLAEDLAATSTPAFSRKPRTGQDRASWRRPQARHSADPPAVTDDELAAVWSVNEDWRRST